MSSSPASNSARVHYRTCNLCEAMCGLEIELEGDAIVAIRGDEDDPFSRGHICPKAVALQDLHADPDRLRRPVAEDRLGLGGDLVGRRPSTGRRAAPRASRSATAPTPWGSTSATPTSTTSAACCSSRPCGTRCGTAIVFSATSVDQLPHHVAARTCSGTTSCCRSRTSTAPTSF